MVIFTQTGILTGITQVSAGDHLFEMDGRSFGRLNPPVPIQNMIVTHVVLQIIGCPLPRGVETSLSADFGWSA